MRRLACDRSAAAAINTAESELQAVSSQALPPTPPAPEYAPRLIPDPDTLNLSEPVDAAFERLVPLRCTVSPEKTSDVLPTLKPTDIDIRRDLPTPCAVLHVIAVSDSQSVSSHTVPLVLAVKEVLAMPNPLPYTGIDAESAGPALLRTSTLIRLKSDETDSVELLTCPPAVTSTRRLDATPAAMLHRVLVSDIHTVHSAADSPLPLRAIRLCIPRPYCDPCTVTDDEPVPAWFDPVQALITWRSAEKLAVLLAPA